jgi:tRNA1Val (adenine37-N6)-methyltransferase
MEGKMQTVQKRRDYFPRGLVQPEDGFRFSMDPLLLACFMKTGPGQRVLDLGTGCGVIGLGMVLRNFDLNVVGADVDPAMVEAARANAELLGVGDRVRFQLLDAARIRESKTIAPESFDMVTANPPYRDPGTGRLSSRADRNPARFEVRGTVEDFVAGAAYAVRNRGRVGMVFPAERLDVLLALMREHRLTPKRVCPVYSRAGEPARLVLVEARKNGGPGMVLEQGVKLYEGTGRETRLKGQALRFCPFLDCNPKK